MSAVITAVNPREEHDCDNGQPQDPVESPQGLWAGLSWDLVPQVLLCLLLIKVISGLLCATGTCKTPRPNSKVY